MNLSRLVRKLLASYRDDQRRDQDEYEKTAPFRRAALDPGAEVRMLQLDGVAPSLR